ncbi:hypothetical protein B1A87_007000 [Arthrobacter sp. KBS0703]|uniref:hypothetical protein n=1 Tax=Arthrobacter sp. KBS0703 TaxID=1955698 RepID=UPI001116879D|nr:hypothetical protein [Arthrobacter sp. KBS0703]TSE15686.1 hypothetical protein B1A87_007000 [Arthrobacter sp. KBS0703]
MCALFASVHIIVGLLSLEMVSSIWPSITAMVFYAAATVMILIPRPKTLTRTRALAAVATVVVMGVMVDSVLPKDEWPGYASWHIAASYTLLVVVNVRGRVLISWVGGVLSVILAVVWASGTTVGFAGGLMMSIATVGWLTLATMIGRLLRSNDLRISQYTADAQAAADRYATDKALSIARNQWLERVRWIVTPALDQISTPGFVPSEADRQEFKLIEAQLRDEIRGRVLATQEVLEAARKARERGVTVQLLDDRRQELTPQMLAAATATIISVLNQARSGTVTARAKPKGGATAVTIFASTPENPDTPTLVEMADRRPET